MVKTTLRKPSTWLVIFLTLIIAISIIPAVKNIKVPLNETDVYCLTRNAYYEAKGDSQMSQIAVTHVVLNRMNDPKFPKKACEVIYQKNSKDANLTVCQVSGYCDKRMMTRVIDSKAWEQSYEAVMKAV
jgi:spore germination cell wall hydrolase CwlJ-like protein